MRASEVTAGPRKPSLSSNGLRVPVPPVPRGLLGRHPWVPVLLSGAGGTPHLQGEDNANARGQRVRSPWRELNAAF